MATAIKKIDDRTYHVNAKPITLDGDGAWIAKVELTLEESTVFSNHLVKIANHE
jgi:hypothetical protein